MAAPDTNNLLLTLAFLLLLAPGARGGSPAIGVTYRHHDARGLPSRGRVASALRAAGIANVHLPDPDPATVRAFLYSNISLLVSIPSSLASNASIARGWIAGHVLPFHPRVRFATISISGGSSHSVLLQAVKNLRAACLHLGLRRIKVSAALYFGALHPALPPSAARFREPRSVRPLLDYLASIGSPVLIELDPYNLFMADFAIPVGFAVFQAGRLGFRDDPGTGLRYGNLFDAMLDAVNKAVRELGHPEMPVVVVGTGWPSGGGGGGREAAAVWYARRYNGGLVEHLKSGVGTPMRRQAAAAVYIRELFDDPKGVRHWGIWFARNLSSKYGSPSLFQGSGGPRMDGGIRAVAMAVSSAAVAFLCWRWDL